MRPVEAEVTAFIRSLPSMGLDELRRAWQDRYGAPPKLRSVDLLRMMLAWRVQADALGGLDKGTVREVATVARRKHGPRLKLISGTRLTREWQGVPYEVEARDGSYLFEGSIYRSLSAVARQITGVRWNGKRFFGVSEKAGQ